MKCIKALKTTKDVEIGDIKRVDDKTAYNMVGSMWNPKRNQTLNKWMVNQPPNLS